jgi:LysM repeat protein
MDYPANQSSNQKVNELSQVYPYVGMKQDSGTFFSYPSPEPVMETPFGPDERFMPHNVKQAESYSKIAETYQTSFEVIQETNDLIEGASL